MVIEEHVEDEEEAGREDDESEPDEEPYAVCVGYACAGYLGTRVGMHVFLIQG